MNGDDTPRALDAELLEEGGRGDLLGAREGVGVQQGAADDGDDDDTKAAAEDLAAVADQSAAGEGAEVGDDLSDGDSVGVEVVLVFEHGRVEVLGAVGLGGGGQR